ncbi:MAG: UDP-N-acetylmuramoyl-tripeptide--D-alanyl-D-alanine ligase [Schleiferiaceae bacterium]|nr:UDP-N-acetylmuramoyl-tripeptide--D-alanyl-D-alanine ligase [Schleiferiaceae bacterium]
MTPFEAYLQCKAVSTDTRNIVPGSVFFALKGARFNGNEFALQALAEGASYAVVDEPVGEDHRLLQVDDVLTTLQDCAKQYRRHLGIPIIGLTGSNGKTTNKELFHAVLSTHFNVHATKGNFNNHIGVPLTLLSIPEATELAVIEMGANHQGEIALLASICEPDLGYITNYGKAHMEGFGGVEGIIKGKSELYDFIRSHNNAYVLLNTDDPIQIEKSQGCATITFGQHSGQYQWLPKAEGEFAGLCFEHEHHVHNVKSQLSGSFNETNIAAAVALGLHYGITAANIVKAIKSYVPSMNRVEWRETAHNKVLLDAYNANPTSMSLSVESFAKWHPNGYLILGDMFELGTAADEEHEAMVQLVCESGMSERCILVGDFFGRTSWEGAHFGTAAELAKYWNEKGAPKDAHILLKGSRGIALEQLLPLL